MLTAFPVEFPRRTKNHRNLWLSDHRGNSVAIDPLSFTFLSLRLLCSLVVCAPCVLCLAAQQTNPALPVSIDLTRDPFPSPTMSTNDAVFYRRNKQIQDAIDGQNLKQALQLIDKRIKKGEDSRFLKVGNPDYGATHTTGTNRHGSAYVYLNGD